VRTEITAAERVEQMHAAAADDEAHIRRFLSANCLDDHYIRADIKIPTIRQPLPVIIPVRPDGHGRHPTASQAMHPADTVAGLSLGQPIPPDAKPPQLRHPVSGEVTRGQITPADRAHLRSWVAQPENPEDAAFAAEACTG
jgi:hypothetical protein